LETDLQAVIAREFKCRVAENTAFALAIYKLAKTGNPVQIHRSNPNQTRFLSGNQAISLGAWLAGLEYYYSYPMTPASSILHYLALQQDSHRVYAIHAESELAAANMAIGSIVAGKKAAVGTSGGGFALMQEAFSLAGMVEAPLLCILSSRPGPATGVSTYTAQEDLFFALHAGHGEFPRIVASPDSFERAFTLAAELLDLAWDTQTPAILLTEKHLSESCTDLDLPLQDVSNHAPQEASQSIYQRYEITDSGVSPLKFPGSGNCTEDEVIKWNSNEHLEAGWRTDTPEDIIAMKDKRQRKAALIRELSQAHQRVAEYGEGEIPVFAYGSTVMELREAMKYIPFKLVAPIYLEPFPIQELEQYQGKPAIVVEHSQTGLFS
ncbi:MAG TPA: 2-oxoacid:acceptor oxidoreductase subunit alpha, partial [Candidatus Cloacimonadota bacterium]|nr:2-oxoacid:acceptor oxidoreductase subunit alpha [Candidatus Cloacimonadota bacterium]